MVTDHFLRCTTCQNELDAFEKKTFGEDIAAGCVDADHYDGTMIDLYILYDHEFLFSQGKIDAPRLFKWLSKHEHEGRYEIEFMVE